jgi:hypothetical protein
MNDEQAGRALGWTSIGLGVAEIAAPLWLSHQLGVGERQALLRALGVREVLSGVGILGRKSASAGMWSRVAGDVLDVALLGLAAINTKKRKVVFGAIAAVVALGVIDVLLASRLTGRRR